MANTYSQIYIHTIFSVKGRQKLISKNFKDELYKYITGIIRNKGQKLLQIGGISDHIHLLIGIEPDIAISDLIKEIKKSSTIHINKNKWTAGKFYWQDGFGAFSYSKSQISSVANYIENQESHHKKKSFEEEYKEILEKFGVEYDEKYLFG
jgi:REP element-mobilizing transposase RayT